MVHATPAVQGDVVLVAGCDEKLRAIRIADGSLAYEIVAGAYTGSSPVVDGNRVYFGTFSDEVLALDLRAKRILWRYENRERQFPFYSSAAFLNGRLIIGGRDKYVHALDAATGKAAWTFATRARVDSSPVIVGNVIYVGSNDGHLYALDFNSGQKRWEFDAGSALSASPAIAAGRIVIGSQDGVLYCFG
jgi:outer membrane protein assembly factor BamB